ncbi:MAG: arylamine N-acetyltransferase [candidate division Zixibacteria bacterium]|nr:arylamine N-acetyltransferase [candidate division Zixibacteria bacterium]
MRTRSLSVDALSEIVEAHLTRIPFENISKLYYRTQNRRSLPTLEQYLDGIERYHFGGTCYPNNYFFSQLLRSLGFQARLCGADMSRPDVHLVIMVIIEEKEYLVDVGYGAPFYTPMPRDLDHELVMILGRERYLLLPRDGSGRSRMQMYRDDQLVHSYLAKPEAREISQFEQVISDSFRDEATFMNRLVVARFFPGRSIVMRDLTLTELRGEQSRSQTLGGRKELSAAIREHFGIPEEITREAISGLGEPGDIYS